MQREVFLDTARQTAENAPRAIRQGISARCCRTASVTAFSPLRICRNGQSPHRRSLQSGRRANSCPRLIRNGTSGSSGTQGKRRCRHNPFSTAPVSAIMRQTREVIRMGYIRRPAYYKAFRCIGSDCTENCCIGWEIDVDEDSLCVLRGRSRRFWRAFAREHCVADAQTESRRIFV